jgi:hypothetical protein
MVDHTNQIHSIQAWHNQPFFDTHRLSHKPSIRVILPTHLHDEHVGHPADTALFLVRCIPLTVVTPFTHVDRTTRSQVHLHQRHGSSIPSSHWQLQYEFTRIPRHHTLTIRTTAPFLQHEAVQTIYMGGNLRTRQSHVTPSSTATRGDLALAHLIQEALYERHRILLFIVREHIRYVMPPIRKSRELCTP